MSDFTIVATKRDDLGKGASRRLRHAKQVLGIVYGADKEPVPFQIPHNELDKLLRHEAVYSSILDLELDGNKEAVVLKDMQRHPHKNIVMHIDLMRIDTSHKLTLNVPIHFLNEETCVGVKKNGGIIDHLINDIEVSCLPSDLPEFIEIDVQALDIDDAIHLGDIKLPEGVEIASLIHGGDPMQSVVSVHKPRVISIDDEGTEESSGDDEEKGNEE